MATVVENLLAKYCPPLKVKKKLVDLNDFLKAGCNLDTILNESLMHLITSKLDQNIIHKLDQQLDQKRINRSNLDAI